MIVYHGSTQIVENPSILVPNRHLDFGNGFYTTESLPQAVSFAGKVSLRRNLPPVVNAYEFDAEGALLHCNVKRFGGPDAEWLDYVVANRNGELSSDEYDIVEGPVADDAVYLTIMFYCQGQLDREATLKRLKVNPLFNQIVFKSEKALAFLKFSKEVN